MESEPTLLHNGIFSQRRTSGKKKIHLDAILKNGTKFLWKRSAWCNETEITIQIPHLRVNRICFGILDISMKKSNIKQKTTLRRGNTLF